MIAENTSFQGQITMEQVMQIVKEELRSAEMRVSTKVESLLKDANQASARNNMKLEFRNKISQEILTCQKIKGEGDTPIEVALVDDSTGNIVDVGPEASAIVEIVLLKGEANALEKDHWTVEEFNENIVPEVDKKPLISGNVPLKLQRGIGVVKNVSVRDHVRKIKPSVFKLGARMVGAFGGHRIKEAKTGSFTLRDFRIKLFRLVNIGKGGEIHKRLGTDQIKTVEDFLIRLLIDPKGLKSIVKLGKKKWEATVENAQACRITSRMYCYIDLEQKKGVVFTVLGEVPGLYFRGHYYLMSAMSENQKGDAQEFLASVYKNWGNVKHFDDMNSLQQYLNDLGTCVDAPDSVKPDYPVGGHENTGISEMVGESSSWYSSNLHHTVCSTMNLTRETGRHGLDWLSTDNGGIMHSFGETSGVDFGWSYTGNGGITDDPMRLSPASHFSMLQDVYEFTDQQNYSCNMQLDGRMKLAVAEMISTG